MGQLHFAFVLSEPVQQDWPNPTRNVLTLHHNFEIHVHQPDQLPDALIS